MENFNKAVALANENIEKTLMKLIANYQFFATLLLNFRREFTVKVPTIGVNVTDEINLIINPYFFNALTDNERLAVLLHECYHVIDNHFVRFRDLEPKIYEKERSLQDKINDMVNASLLNQAADYAINEYIPTLPKQFKVFDENGKHIDDGEPCLVSILRNKIPDIKDKETMEYYYTVLKQDNNNSNTVTMLIDDHSLWHEGDATQDEINQKVKSVVNKAVEAVGGIGNVPSDVKRLIDQLNYTPKDWRGDVQRFVARTSEIIIQSSRKKRNRRYGILYPGHIKEPKLHIAVGVDTSGSIYEEELSQFMAEMTRLHNMEIKLTVLVCDCELKSVQEFNPRKKLEFNGGGGTSFKPVFDECSKLEIDGLIYFTDGLCYNEKIDKPKYPVLWALVGKNNKPPYNWGSKTYIEVRKKVKV